MRILMLSWEYPPRIVGGLGKHVHRLSVALARAGHDVHVVTRGHPDAPSEEVLDGVRVLRAGEYPPSIEFSDLVPWVLQFNISVYERAAKLLLEEDVDVIHAHDWLVAYAAASAKNTFETPLVTTVHATEYGRHQGYLPGPMNKLIHQVEWWLTYEARRVITCSDYMRDQVQEIFELPAAKQDVIPNGVELDEYARPDGVDDFRAARIAPGEKLLFFAGRLEYEKGVQTVLDALPLVLEREPIRFYVAGVGTHAEELKAHARRLGLSERVHFLGFVEENELRMYYAAADLAVVPSIYEPFGMVALETMASGTPCIAADTGGLRELVVHDATGLRFQPGDPKSLAGMILRLTTDKRLDHRLTLDARRMLDEQFSWRSIARKTVEVYARAISEEAELRRGLRKEERVPLRVILGRSAILAESG
ncbi:MAG TPA: glycosyltransferase family 4 protein [Actinomycetota bacterium]|nr:glycosyltransferase family 4 protein [Actinomycetota bacterium]